MARVFKHKGTWWLDFNDADGTRHRVNTKITSKRVAHELLNDALTKVAKQEHLGILDVKVPFAQFADEWLATVKPAVRARTYESYERIVRKHLKPTFTGLLKAVTSASVDSYVADRRERGAAPATINVEVACLKAICSLAVERCHLKRNAIAGRANLKGPAGRTRFLSPEEINELLESCGRAPTEGPVPGAYLRPFTVVALNTGMRRNEILSLSRRTVDFAARIATLTETKSGEARHIPLNAAVIDVLRSLPKRLDTDRFFPFKPLDVTRAFGAAVARASIEDFRLHDCRHTFASYQAMSGLAPRALQELLGHADGRMTERYSHLSDAYLRAAVDRVMLGASTVASPTTPDAKNSGEFGTYLAPALDGKG
jgi:integrase